MFQKPTFRSSLGYTRYNEAGELTSKSVGEQAVTYDYDVLGNLRKVVLSSGTTIDYVIDSAQRRVGKKVDGASTKGWLYQDGLNPIAELDGAGNVVSRFVYGTRPNVPDFMIKGGLTYRIIPDHLGSPRLVVDSSTGMVVQELRYDEFGRITLDTNLGFQPFGFAGGLYDHQTGLVRFGARDYDPEVGRWTAVDPIGFRSSQSNLYSYVGGNPTNFNDLFGLDRVLGIHSNVPADSGLASGHAWISVTDPATGKTKNFGLWPDDHPRTVDNGAGTDVREGLENGATAKLSRYYALGPSQERSLSRFLNRPSTWEYSRTCADWASNAVKETTGEDVDADDWLGIETPREVTKSIKALEKKNPTSAQQPSNSPANGGASSN